MIAACTNEIDGVIDVDEQSSKIFTSSFEAPAETKVFVDQYFRLYWTKDDMVSIFTRGLNEQYRFTGETGDIGGTFEMVSAPVFGTGSQMSANYSVYPFYSDTKIDYDGNITVTLPAVQNYLQGSFGLGANLMVAVTEGPDDYFLPYKNACSYLALNLYGNACVKEIVFEGNDNEPIAGKATIASSHTEMPDLQVSSTGTASLTLDCGDGVTIGQTSSEATTFWIVVPPITFEKGFTITVTDVNGDSYVKSTSKKQVFTRNICKDMSPMEVTSTSAVTHVINVSLDQENILFTEEGQQVQLHANVYPENATNKKVFWTSFDESVATVDENGLVTATGNGETTITVTTEDGEKTAEAKATADWEAPLIVSTEFSATEIDVTDADQTLTIDMHITDKSGVADGMMIYLYDFTHGNFAGSIERISGTDKDGIYRATFKLTQETLPGERTVNLLRLKDKNGWTSDGGITTLGKVNIVNNKQFDNEAPIIVSMDIASKTVDVSESGQTFTFDMHITDESGVADGMFVNIFHSVYGSIQGTVERVSGNAKDGIYRASIFIPHTTAPGERTVFVNKLKDINGLEFGNGSGSLGFKITVVNTSDQDFSAPEIVSLEYPKEVDVTNGPQTFTISLHITDDSGVDDSSLSTEIYSFTYGTQRGSIRRISGDQKDGYYEATYEFSQETGPGERNIHLDMKDILGNEFGYGSDIIGKVNIINNYTGD